MFDRILDYVGTCALFALTALAVRLQFVRRRTIDLRAPKITPLQLLVRRRYVALITSAERGVVPRNWPDIQER